MQYDFILEVSNTLDPFLYVSYKEKEEVKTSRMSLKYDEEGKIVDAVNVAQLLISHFNTKGKKCLLLLDLNDSININRYYQNLSIRKARKLYDTSLDEDFPDLKKYKTYSYEFEVGGNSLLGNYAMNYETLDYYEKFVEKCNFSTVEYRSKSLYLMDQVMATTKNDTFALFYCENDVLYFVECVKEELIYSITTKNDATSINRLCLGCIDNLNYQLRKSVINTVYSNFALQINANTKVNVIKLNKSFTYEGERF